MRILILTNYFPPEVGAASHLFYDLAEELGERGHEVTVVTGFPRYLMGERRERGLFRRERVGRSRVVRVASSPFDQGGPIRRGLDHLYLAASLFVGGSLAGKTDIVFVYSPPLPTGAAAWALARLRGVPYAVNVQDLFPQSAIDLGLLKSKRLIAVFEALERFIYRTAEGLTVHSEGNREHLLQRGAPGERVRVVPNWVDTDFIRPGPTDNAFRQEWGLGGRFVVQFAGIMGYSQDLDTVVEAATFLRDEPEIVIQLVGEGVERPGLEEKARRLGLSNVVFTPMQPRERYPRTVQAADACLVTLHKEVQTPVVPSKLLSIMAAGKPVLMSAPLEGDASPIVRAAGCGLCVPPGEPQKLAEAILHLYRDRAGAEEMGRRGRAYVEQEFSRSACVGQYEQLFEELTGSSTTEAHHGQTTMRRGVLHTPLRSAPRRFENTRGIEMTDRDNRYFEGRTVLVTGGAGCIGSNLTRGLVEAGAERVIVLDDLSSAYSWNVPSLPEVEFVEGDILDEALMGALMRRGVTVVYHLAALFANQNSIDHPHRDLEVNGLGTLKLLELARDVGVDKFVFASSGCSVYGSKAPLPLTEDFVSLDLDTPYQITKLLGELYCNFFHHYYSVPVVRARFFNVYGPGEVPGQYRNVIPNFIYRAMRHEPLTVTGTGEETRDFTFVEDVVDGLLRLGARPEAVGEAVNLASGRETTVNYLAEYINGAIGNPAGVQYTSRRDWDQIVRRRASVDKARSLVGYEPKVAMSDGLDRTIAWFRENWDQIEDGARFSGERAAQAIS